MNKIIATHLYTQMSEKFLASLIKKKILKWHASKTQPVAKILTRTWITDLKHTCEKNAGG